MKVIDIINKIFYIVTVTFFLVTCFGILVEGLYTDEYVMNFWYLLMYMMIALGFIQVISSLILIFYFKKMKLKFRKLLIVYWLMVISFFVIHNFLTEMIYFIIPMCIATYFTFMVHHIQKNNS